MAQDVERSAVVVLLRHGESTFIVEGRFQGAADSPLSPLGERQAALAGERLAEPGRSPALPIPPVPPLEIAHSPLGRAASTAEAVRAAIAARGSSVPIRPEPGLAEIGQGRWEGAHRTEIESQHGELLAAWRRTPLIANAPDGERVLDAAVRVRGALDTVVARLGEAAASRPASEQPPTVAGYPGPAVADVPWTLLVAHDGIFKVTLLTLLDLPLDRFWTFPFALCGITIVELRDGRGILRAHNLTEHLAPLAATAPARTNGAL
jgi:probable phosphoglycerate mutase